MYVWFPSSSVMGRLGAEIFSFKELSHETNMSSRRTSVIYWRKVVQVNREKKIKRTEIVNREILESEIE